jgi:ferredoxin
VKKTNSRVTRRIFVIAGSAVAATPLLADLAAPRAEAQAAAEIPAGTKVYFINNQCVGCQVCKTYCPAQAIRFGNCGNEIVQSKCVHCGTCYKGCHISNISETVVA